MAKRIWIVNYYTGTPETQLNPRYGQFARRFMDAGYDVITINSSLTSNTQEEQTASGQVFLERQYGDSKFIHINAPAYHGNGLKRMGSLLKFSLMLKKAAKHYPKPDIVLHNIHPPFDYPIVTMSKRLGAKYIAEAWDLWPESFVRFGLISESNPLMKVAHAIEKKYYYSASEIVFTLKGAPDYLRKKGWTTDVGGKIDLSNVHYINNGIDLEQFYKNREAFPRLDEDINSPELFRIVYLGSINKANNVKTLVDAALLLKDNPKYRFFIYGNGAYRKDLIRYVAYNQIDNVVFKEERIPLAECAWVVSQATVNVMNYEKGFGKWGVSSGKMFQYLAAGKPIVCNRKFHYDDVIMENNLGIAQELETPEAFAQAIKRLAEQPQEEYDAMCRRVLEVAKKYDYKVLSEEELKVIES